MLIDPIRAVESPVQAGVASASASSRPASSPPPTSQVSDQVTVQWEGEDGVVVKFTDPASGELIRQIPPEQILSVARYIRQLLQQEQESQGA